MARRVLVETRQRLAYGTAALLALGVGVSAVSTPQVAQLTRLLDVELSLETSAVKHEPIRLPFNVAVPRPQVSLALPAPAQPVPVPAAPAPAPAPAQRAAEPGPAAVPFGGMRHVPQWVQAVRKEVVLFTSDADNAGRAATQPRYAFMQVLDTGRQRLKVQPFTNVGAPAGPAAWVDPEDVQPSQPGTGWNKNHQATTLYAAAQGDASKAALPQWSYLRVTGAAQNGRVPVRAYSGEAERVVGDGWVLQGAIGPVGVPKAAVIAPNEGAAPANPNAGERAFIEAVGGVAQRVSKQSLGAPASVTVAQAILESEWGNSMLARRAQNYFGMKALSGLGSDGAIWFRTMEYDASGNEYWVYDPFRAYKSLADSILDHDRLFTRASRYRSAVQARNDPREFARRVMAAGYSTDPQYAAKLISLMDRYDLYRFDR